MSCYNHYVPNWILILLSLNYCVLDMHIVNGYVWHSSLFTCLEMILFWRYQQGILFQILKESQKTSEVMEKSLRKLGNWSIEEALVIALIPSSGILSTGHTALGLPSLMRYKERCISLPEYKFIVPRTFDLWIKMS